MQFNGVRISWIIEDIYIDKEIYYLFVSSHELRDLSNNFGDN